MIGFLEGVILRVQGDRCWILVSGVGHIVSVGHTWAKALSVQQTIALWIETMVHDGQHNLFGFKTHQEQNWFQALILVSGVGGRLAMSILSDLEPNALADTITHNHVARLRSIDGVGPKLANRLMTELKDRAQAWVKTERPSDVESYSPLVYTMHQDAVLALVALGYRPSDAESVVARTLAQSKPASVEEVITQCFPLLSSC